MLLTIIAILGLVLASAIEADAKFYKQAGIDPEYVSICDEVGKEYGISPELLEAIIERESGGDVTAHDATCHGLMGISAYWNRDRMKRLGITDIYDPKSNITLGADILLELFEEYEDPYTVLMHYNGSSHTDARVEAGDYSDYALWVTERARELEIVHGKAEP